MAVLNSFPFLSFYSSAVFVVIICFLTAFPDASEAASRGGRTGSYSRIGSGRIIKTASGIKGGRSYFIPWVSHQTLNGSQIDAIVLLIFVVIAIGIAILGYYCHQRQLKASENNLTNSSDKQSTGNKPPAYSASTPLINNRPSMRTPLLERSPYGEYATYAEAQPLFSYSPNSWENEDKSKYYCTYTSPTKPTITEATSECLSSQENQRNLQENERLPATPRRILPSIPPLYAPYCSQEEQNAQRERVVRRLLPRIPLVYVPYTSQYSERVPRRLLPRTPPPTYSSIFLDNSFPPPSYSVAVESQYYENNQCFINK